MTFRTSAAACFWVTLLWAPGTFAAPLTTSVAALGLTAHDVQQAFPEAVPVRAPARLSSGAIGLLRQAHALCEGLPFAQTFYFKAEQLTQVEMTWLGDESHASTDSASAFTALVRSISSQLGAELSTAASTATTVMESASWTNANSSVVLFRSGKADKPVVRLVVRQRELVDGSTL